MGSRIWANNVDSVVKNPSANVGDVCSIPGLGRSLGEGNGNPLQYSCLEKSMVSHMRRVQLSDQTTTFSLSLSLSFTLSERASILHYPKVKVKVKPLSRVWLFAIPWTVSMGSHGIFQARVLEWVAVYPKWPLHFPRIISNIFIVLFCYLQLYLRWFIISMYHCVCRAWLRDFQ